MFKPPPPFEGAQGGLGTKPQKCPKARFLLSVFSPQTDDPGPSPCTKPFFRFQPIPHTHMFTPTSSVHCFIWKTPQSSREREGEREREKERERETERAYATLQPTLPKRSTKTYITSESLKPRIPSRYSPNHKSTPNPFNPKPPLSPLASRPHAGRPQP